MSIPLFIENYNQCTSRSNCSYYCALDPGTRAWWPTPFWAYGTRITYQQLLPQEEGDGNGNKKNGRGTLSEDCSQAKPGIRFLLRTAPKAVLALRFYRIMSGHAMTVRGEVDSVGAKEQRKAGRVKGCIT